MNHNHLFYKMLKRIDLSKEKKGEIKGLYYIEKELRGYAHFTGSSAEQNHVEQSEGKTTLHLLSRALA